ncbi:reverse transcriptase domain-containing protein [Tanacetum coccineum]|uniref:Reverse transcriptase domain-containing protein n=1 Tax=Tanacetum coccineum TaxID=301880 RepID=A0ABQ5CI94_9ASTR
MEILKGLQFRQVEESEFNNLFHDHIQAEDENAEDVQMAYHLRPMEKLLRIRIVCIENAIVVLAILVDEFELKTELLDFVSNNSFFGLENDDPHSHIRRFYQITKTLKLNQVPDDVVKLILFLFSLKGAAETWLEELRKEILNFQQIFGETFTQAWERFKDLLRKCPHHGFSPLNQIDFFYNGLSQSDQDFLNTAAGGNLMSKNTQEALTIIENRSKVRTCRNKPQVLISGGSSIQNDAITALTKQVKALKKEQEPETITEVVGIASSKSTPLVLPLETPPLSTPKQKENLEHNPHQLLLKKENFQALNNPTGRVGHLVYRIDIVDSLWDKIPIENNSLSGNPTSSNLVVDSLSSLPTPFGNNDYLLEETDTLLSYFDDSLPEYETFSFDIGEKKKSSGSTTTHSNFSLPEYESFYFDLSIDPLPPADMSDSHHEEFADELTHITSPPEYDRFYFDIEPDLEELTILFKENISKDSTKELTSPELNVFPLLLSDCDSSLSKEFSEIDLLVFFRNEEIIFDPRIFIIKRV